MGLLRELHKGIKHDFLIWVLRKMDWEPLPSQSWWTGLCGVQTKQAWHFHFLLKRKRIPFVLCLEFGGHVDLWALWTVVFMVILVVCGCNDVSRNEIRVMQESRILHRISATGYNSLGYVCSYFVKCIMFTWNLVFPGREEVSSSKLVPVKVTNVLIK